MDGEWGGRSTHFLMRERARIHLPSECVNTLLTTMVLFVKEAHRLQTLKELRTTLTTKWTTRNTTKRRSGCFALWNAIGTKEGSESVRLYKRASNKRVRL